MQRSAIKINIASLTWLIDSKDGSNMQIKRERERTNFSQEQNSGIIASDWKSSALHTVLQLPSSTASDHQQFWQSARIGHDHRQFLQGSCNSVCSSYTGLPVTEVAEFFSFEGFSLVRSSLDSRLPSHYA